MALSRSPRPGSNVLAPGLWGALVLVIRNQSKATLVCCWTHGEPDWRGERYHAATVAGVLEHPERAFRTRKPTAFLLVDDTPPSA